MSLRSRASLAALVLAACTLPPKGGDTVDPSVNVCPTDDEPCGNGGICRSGLCLASDVAADLPILFVITRSQVSGASNVQPVPVLDPNGKPWSLRALARQRLADPSAIFTKLEMPPLASLDISLLGAENNIKTARGDCFPVENLAGDGATLPMTVTLLPSASLRGLGLATYGRRASDPRIDPPQSLHATLSVPPATYDVYVVPDVRPDCPLPPLLMRDLVPTSGRLTTLQFDLNKLASSKLGASVTTSPSFDLTDWTARLVDAATGLTVSTVVTFFRSGPTSWSFGALALASGKPVPTRLEFYPQLSLPTQDPSPSPVFLVMTPPDGVIAPQLAWDLAAINAFDQATLSLDLTSLSLDTVDVELRTEGGDSPAGQRASVLLATEATPGSLVGAPAGSLAFFSPGLTPTDASGVVQLRLLPGNYRALAVALDDRWLDLGDRSFTFLPRADGGTLAGFALPLPGQVTLDVPILPPSGNTTLSSVPFSITPSLTTAPLLERVFGAPSLHPRANSGSTGDDGHLNARVDTGLFDVTLRLPIDRGFPWLVKPSVSLPLAVDADAPTPTLRVSLPVEVLGVATDPLATSELQRPLSGARLQAFALLPGGTYVQIAEGMMDIEDRFRLLLPSSL